VYITLTISFSPSISYKIAEHIRKCLTSLQSNPKTWRWQDLARELFQRNYSLLQSKGLPRLLILKVFYILLNVLILCLFTYFITVCTVINQCSLNMVRTLHVLVYYNCLQFYLFLFYLWKALFHKIHTWPVWRWFLISFRTAGTAPQLHIITNFNNFCQITFQTYFFYILFTLQDLFWS